MFFGFTSLFFKLTGYMQAASYLSLVAGAIFAVNVIQVITLKLA